MRINDNASSAITQNPLRGTGLAMNISLERLSTGLRINLASDDAAGLSVSEQLRTQVRGSAQAQRNTQDSMPCFKLQKEELILT